MRTLVVRQVAVTRMDMGCFVAFRRVIRRGSLMFRERRVDVMRAATEDSMHQKGEQCQVVNDQVSHDDVPFLQQLQGNESISLSEWSIPSQAELRFCVKAETFLTPAVHSAFWSLVNTRCPGTGNCSSPLKSATAPAEMVCGGNGCFWSVMP